MGFSLAVRLGGVNGGAGNASGSLAISTVSALIGLATGAALTTSLLASLAVSPVEAVAGGSSSATGLVPLTTVSTINSTSTGAALASGSMKDIIVTSAEGSADVSSIGAASGTVPNALVIPTTSSAYGAGSSTGDLISTNIIAPTGVATGIGTGIGDLSSVLVSSPTVISTGQALGQGSVSGTTVSPVTGSATSGSSGAGTGTVANAFVNQVDATGSGASSVSSLLTNTNVVSPLAGANGAGKASVAISGIVVSTVTGNASVGTGVTVRQILTKLYQDTHTAEEVGVEVWQHPTAIELVQDIGLIDKAVHVNTEQVANGDGSQANPFNNLDDTLTFAESNGYKLIHVLADITIDRNLKNFVVTGIGTAVVIDCNGYDLHKSRFQYCTMRGQYTGTIIAQDSVLDDGFYLNGFFNNCVLNGDLVCVNGSKVLIMLCSSFVQGNQQPSISMVASGTCELGVRFYSGGFELRDMNNSSDKCSIEPVAGAITLANSCTSSAGSLSLKGNSSLVNNSTIVNMDNKLFNPLAVWNHTQ